MKIAAKKLMILSALALVLFPSSAYASDMGMLIPFLFSPALVAGTIAALVLRSLIKKYPEKRWPSFTLLGLFCIISIPAVFCAYVAATYLGSSYRGDAQVHLALFAGYCIANFFALRTYFLSRKPADAAAPSPAKGVRKLVLVWAGLALLLLGWFFGQAAYRDYKVEKSNKEYEAKRLANIILYGHAAFTPDGRCRAADNPQADAEEERRLYSARLAAEENGKERLFAEVKKLKLKSGGSVGEAVASDPALAERLLAAVAGAKIMSDADCAVWKSTCSLKMGLPKSALPAAGLEIVDPGRLNYTIYGNLDKF